MVSGRPSDDLFPTSITFRWVVKLGEHSFLATPGQTPKDCVTEPCSKCGITIDEFHSHYQRPIPCTGDAYVCRKLRSLFNLGLWFQLCVVDNPSPVSFTRTVRGPSIEDVQRPRRLQPWEGKPHDLSSSIHNGIYRMKLGNNTIHALLRRIEDHPTDCPILADALEEAGCDDQIVLSILRAP